MQGLNIFKKIIQYKILLNPNSYTASHYFHFTDVENEAGSKKIHYTQLMGQV